MQNHIDANHSPTIGKLAEALSKAQGVIEGAEKDGSNPFHKSKYMTLSSVWEACRVPLSQNGIAVIQTVEKVSDKDCLVTMLAHTSGEWIKSFMPLMMSKMDSQGLGSAITYSRRYALSAMVGICAMDDDGEAACGRYPNQNKEYPAKKSYQNIQEAEEKKIESIAKISADQWALLDALFEEDKNPEEAQQKIKSTLKIESLQEMRANDFERVIKWMKQRKEESNANTRTA